MATLFQLKDIGALVKIDPSLEAGELEHRLIYATPICWNRIENELGGYASTWSIEETPIQQFDALLEVFCSGETLTFDRRFKPLNHLGAGIWELKTADLRLFGWFAHRDCFVATTIDLVH